MATEQQEEVREFSFEQTIICEGFSQILLPNLKKATRHLPKFQPCSSFPTRPWRKQRNFLTFFMDKYSYFWQDKAT